MSEAQITNGTVTYGRTEKMAEYESKRADVSLSFKVEEDQDASQVLLKVTAMCQEHVDHILGTKRIAEPMPMEAKAEAKAKPAKAPPIPATPKAAPKAEPVGLVGSGVEADPLDDGLDDLMGEEAPPAKREITDKELTDATQKCQASCKNAPAIRKLLTELGVKSPPGRIIDLLQEKRQEYLDGLNGIKPLA